MSEDTTRKDSTEGVRGDPPASAGTAATGLDISGEQIAQFMTEREDRYACPICDCTNWLGMTDGTGRTACVPWMAPSGQLEPTAVRVLAMFCAQCGYLRMHQVDMFKNYLDSLKRE
ncbi:hypothetical protein B0E51_13265 [Rhodanobacter sp. C05]|nr:hypothetical protein B0E51_13265 [Rhodanobacter sp. C05]